MLVLDLGPALKIINANLGLGTGIKDVNFKAKARTNPMPTDQTDQCWHVLPDPFPLCKLS